MDVPVELATVQALLMASTKPGAPGGPGLCGSEHDSNPAVVSARAPMPVADSQHVVSTAINCCALACAWTGSLEHRVGGRKLYDASGSRRHVLDAARMSDLNPSLSSGTTNIN